MTKQDCIEAINTNFTERRRKFSPLFSDTNKYGDRIQGEIIIVFLYAHFEGFIADATSLYIQLANHELSSGIVKLEDEIKFEQNVMWKTIFKINSLQKDSFDQKCEEMLINQDEKDFIDKLQTKNKKMLITLICKKLADYRNHIAHGGLTDSMNIEDIKMLSRISLKIMDNYRDFLQEAIENEKYKIVK